MDQKNEPTNGVNDSDAATTPQEQTESQNEVRVDLASDANLSSASTDAPATNAFAQPAATSDGQAIDQEAPSVAFTTDSSGNVQTVVQPEQPAENTFNPNPEVVPTESTPTDPMMAPAEPQAEVADTTPNPADIAAPAVASEVTTQNDAQPIAPSVVDPAAQFGQQPAEQSVAPEVAPVPVAPKDKKLLVILAAVALVLLTAIVAMMFK